MEKLVLHIGAKDVGLPPISIAQLRRRLSDFEPVRAIEQLAPIVCASANRGYDDHDFQAWCARGLLSNELLVKVDKVRARHGNKRSLLFSTKQFQIAISLLLQNDPSKATRSIENDGDRHEFGELLLSIASSLGDVIDDEEEQDSYRRQLKLSLDLTHAFQLEWGMAPNIHVHHYLSSKLLSEPEFESAFSSVVSVPPVDYLAGLFTLHAFFGHVGPRYVMNQCPCALDIDKAFSWAGLDKEVAAVIRNRHVISELPCFQSQHGVPPFSDFRPFVSRPFFEASSGRCVLIAPEFAALLLERCIRQAVIDGTPRERREATVFSFLGDHFQSFGNQVVKEIASSRAGQGATSTGPIDRQGFEIDDAYLELGHCVLFEFKSGPMPVEVALGTNVNSLASLLERDYVTQGLGQLGRKCEAIMSGGTTPIGLPKVIWPVLVVEDESVASPVLGQALVTRTAEPFALFGPAVRRPRVLHMDDLVEILEGPQTLSLVDYLLWLERINVMEHLTTRNAIARISALVPGPRRPRSTVLASSQSLIDSAYCRVRKGLMSHGVQNAKCPHCEADLERSQPVDGKVLLQCSNCLAYEPQYEDTGMTAAFVEAQNRAMRKYRGRPEQTPEADPSTPWV